MKNKNLIQITVLSVVIVFLSSCSKNKSSVDPIPVVDCAGIENGIAAEDDCGTCHKSYMYSGMGNLTTVDTYADTTGLDGMFILAGSPSDIANNPLWRTSVTPPTYAFNFDGNSTVSYSGQAGRLATAKAVYDALNDNVTIDRAALDLIIDNTNSKLFTKTAENDQSNDYDRSTVMTHINTILDTYCANSAAFEAGTAATAGTAGMAGNYQLDARGWEADQQFAKMLIGALCLEQVSYDYLTKMDVDNSDRTYSTGNNYTKREHYYDEAYGYVYGLDDNDLDAAINNGLLLGKYLNKHDSGNDNSGVDYRQRVYDAFKMGRQAVVDECPAELNRQITEINNCLSKVVAWHAQDYLKSAALAIGTNSFFHDVSEAWGFVYSLQFTKVDGVAIFTANEVMGMIATLDAGESGAYSLDAPTLNNMATTINNAVTFD